MNDVRMGRRPQLTLSRGVQIPGFNEVQLIGNEQLWMGWDDGIPTVHVFSQLLQPSSGEVDPTTKLVLHVRWSSEQGGGQATIDCVRGLAFTLGAAQSSITLAAQFVPIDEGADPSQLVHPGNTMVSCVIGGIGSLGPQRPICSGLRSQVNVGATSAARPVPDMAVRGKILTDGTTVPAFMQLQMSTEEAFHTTFVANTGDEWTEVCAGQAWYKIKNANGQQNTKAFAIWELSL